MCIYKRGPLLAHSLCQCLQATIGLALSAVKGSLYCEDRNTQASRLSSCIIGTTRPARCTAGLICVFLLLASVSQLENAALCRIPLTFGPTDYLSWLSPLFPSFPFYLRWCVPSLPSVKSSNECVDVSSFLLMFTNLLFSSCSQESQNSHVMEQE